MRSFSQWIITLCATPAGVVLLAALDSTVFFYVPLGIDAAVVFLAARIQSWWIVPVLATIGSLAGAAVTFWIGIMAGEKGLDRYVPSERLDRVRSRIRHSGAFALALLNLVPPPFPFTAVVLAAGTLEVKRTTFFAMLALSRLLRFGIEAALAARYGRHILSWLDSVLFQLIVVFFIGATVVLTALSIVRLARSPSVKVQA